MALVRDKEKRSKIRKELYEKLDQSGASLSQTVKGLRQILSKDQEEFAEMLGISLATLRKIEQRNGNFTMKSVRKILDRFSLELVVKTKRSRPEADGKT